MITDGQDGMQIG